MYGGVGWPLESASASSSDQTQSRSVMADFKNRLGAVFPEWKKVIGAAMRVRSSDIVWAFGWEKARGEKTETTIYRGKNL